MGYYDDADVDLLAKPWYFPPDGQQFTGRQATINTGDFQWWDTNGMNWRDLIKARDWAWQLNQGMLITWQGVAGDWFRNNRDRPGMAGPFPNPPAAYVALTKYVDKVSSDGTVETDGNGNPVRMFEQFAVVQGSALVCPVPQH